MALDAAAAAEDPHVERGALAGDDVGLGARRRRGRCRRAGRARRRPGRRSRASRRAAAGAARPAAAKRGEPRRWANENGAGISSPSGVCVRRRRGARRAAVARPAAEPGAAEAEVDAAGVQRVEDAELLDDRQRRVVAHLHGAGADPDALGGGGDEGDDQRRRRAGDARVEVVLGDPVAAVAGGLGAPGEVDGVGEGLAGRATRWGSGRGRGRRAGWSRRGHPAMTLR